MILVCGEALVDLFIKARGAGGLDAEAVVGGSPFNVAVGLARLGCPAAFCGAIARDPLGEELVATLVRNGIDVAHVRRSDRPTTLSVATATQDGSVHYRFYGEEAADRDLPADALPDCSGFSAIAVGSYSLGVEPVGATIETLLAREGARRVVSIDPNLRPDLISDMGVWRERFARLVTHATIVKASVEDIATAYGEGVNVDEMAASWLAAGVKLVAVTRGEKGASAYLANGTVLDVPARPIRLVDAVGAGDTFHAALLAFLAGRGKLDRQAIATIDHETVTQALHYAVSAASITCSRRGADLPSQQDVEAILHERTMA
ncbi:hypothetical protein BOQ54_09830 [Chelatococcus daeguensis]|uniref:Carbohydrate kinase PfkB domain-containing protein n=1 Tax=Chelatococcus daeguensis TaxID=444444 RepID=A0AAC9JUQ3_9HYPH|nr:carbohydrate kinase [Chelatococcus daeguensis]APF37592.1 hypothetical protein BOQ54_09830 [Chelatococcus daeguensis]